ncbi:3-keto-5-aminohexanoate cleavage protein [Limibaculum sp. FT325]|uniref:3-keto-5-aminohexanoate cleavage protein n=1 Tax=Thermohalobaculum sediminis TaxID=2939436 RepID=UPI0020C1449B|nr:3-keto-5-aminohexanoate cleavage protein [Limibaculum sediminis]MCL5776257.1 3-keto-5-aminohexanoate cleavage protein [Limibaculum sediminis]
MTDPCIISCAITGSIHTPSMTPYLPITADEIARSAIDAAHAGATILHLHARNPANGRPSADPDDYMAFLPRIAAETDAIINITTGGSAIMTLADRLAPAMRAEPEMCSINMGSMNFAMYPAAARITEWKHDWEKPFLEGSEDLIFKNTPRDIAHVLDEMGAKRGARFEFECYEAGHLHMLHHFVQRGVVKPPFFVQFVLGVLGAMMAEPEHVMHLKATADRLFGKDYRFSVLGAGRQQMPLAAMSAAMGGHVRVGLEDSIWIERGRLATSNAEQVTRVRGIVEGIGRRVATPDEARAMLGLKGRDRVAFTR